MTETIRPRLIVSRCFGFDAVRFDGAMINDHHCEALFEHCDVIHVCPEMSIGLGVPRPKIRLVPAKDINTLPELIQPDTKRELTEEMEVFAAKFCSQLSRVDGFVLKSKSPSCGVGNAKLYRQQTGEGFDGTVDGVFVRIARNYFPNAIFVDEVQLANDGVESILAELIAIARKVNQ